VVPARAVVTDWPPCRAVVTGFMRGPPSSFSRVWRSGAKLAYPGCRSCPWFSSFPFVLSILPEDHVGTLFNLHPIIIEQMFCTVKFEALPFRFRILVETLTSLRQRRLLPFALLPRKSVRACVGTRDVVDNQSAAGIMSENIVDSNYRNLWV
jgi:hypothetical protein